MQDNRRAWLGAFVTTAAGILCFSFLLMSSSGCVALAAVGSAIPVTVQAKYAGLANHSVGVMVWADRGVRIDWETVQIDLANTVQDKLQVSNAGELKGASWPWKPASILRYERDHPGIEALPAVDVAPKLQVQRLIYIEVNQFRTRSETALELFRGETTVTLKVIEVENGVGKLGYSEENVRASFPKSAPPDGLPNIGDRKIYMGTIDALATEIVNRLTTHEEDRDTRP